MKEKGSRHPSESTVVSILDVSLQLLQEKVLVKVSPTLHSEKNNSTPSCMDIILRSQFKEKANRKGISSVVAPSESISCIYAHL